MVISYLPYSGLSSRCLGYIFAKLDEISFLWGLSSSKVKKNKKQIMFYKLRVNQGGYRDKFGGYFNDPGKATAYKFLAGNM